MSSLLAVKSRQRVLATSDRLALCYAETSFMCYEKKSPARRVVHRLITTAFQYEEMTLANINNLITRLLSGTRGGKWDVGKPSRQHHYNMLPVETLHYTTPASNSFSPHLDCAVSISELMFNYVIRARRALARQNWPTSSRTRQHVVYRTQPGLLVTLHTLLPFNNNSRC